MDLVYIVINFFFFNIFIMTATSNIATASHKVAVTTKRGGTFFIIATIKNGILCQSRLSTASEQAVNGNFVVTPFRVSGLRDSYVLQPGFRLSGLLAKPAMVEAMYPELYPFFDFK